MNRRDFNKTLVLLTGVSAGAALSAIPLKALAAWPADAFGAESVDAAATALYGSADAEASDAITIEGPDIAENGAVVPVSVSTTLPNVDSIALMAANNPSPLVATFDGGATAASTRIKMGKSSPLVGYVRSDGKLYTATSKEIKVTIGGCGG